MELRGVWPSVAETVNPHDPQFLRLAFRHGNVSVRPLSLFAIGLVASLNTSPWNPILLTPGGESAPGGGFALWPRCGQAQESCDGRCEPLADVRGHRLVLRPAGERGPRWKLQEAALAHATNVRLASRGVRERNGRTPLYASSAARPHLTCDSEKMPPSGAAQHRGSAVRGGGQGGRQKPWRLILCVNLPGPRGARISGAAPFGACL